jgi:hypothetical protein
LSLFVKVGAGATEGGAVMFADHPGAGHVRIDDERAQGGVVDVAVRSASMNAQILERFQRRRPGRSVLLWASL